ncbi:MAG TPA: hypothetical protein VHW47_01430, partial [Acidimicrobiales bacterium]|nr:hypothetical protein [Acidimicrobiales bacterium]
MTVPDPADLQAVSGPVDPATIPEGLPGLAGTDGCLFAADRYTLVGMGTAATLPLPGGLDDPSGLAAAQRWLAAVSPVAVSPAGSGGGAGGGAGERPVGRVTALAALPFDRDAPGTLLVPELVVGREGAGRAWAVLV